MNLGVIGLSPQNGHPYSFSAIINGYNEPAMQQSGWIGILNYLKKAKPSQIGFPDAEVTHVWTQDRAISQSISESCLIPNISNHVTDMMSEVDAVIIARDDYKTHLELSRPFLEEGIPVFIDKPLTLSPSEMVYFTPFLKSGKLMSCSGLRYATELDSLRENPSGCIGELQGVSCGVINGWEKYGIHMLDAVLGIYPGLQLSRIIRHASIGDAITIETVHKETISILCLGENAPVFSINFYGTTGVFSATISNNFGAFRRTMRKFVEQVKSGEASIPFDVTKKSIEVMIAGAELREGESLKFQK